MTAPADPTVPVQPGDLLLGKYKVERLLGAGGMGVVVAALHLELEQRVAIKFLNAEVLENTEAVARFMREARASVRIKSDHVARVIDVGRLENGAPYMVMEYLNGEDMSAAVRRGALAVEDAVDYVIQACDAMAEAHVEGIIHRDLKPGNLFLQARTDGSTQVKVLDFGISKLVTPELRDAELTKTSAILGSPLYMSPEQMRSSRSVDLRTDIWSLGVILYELLSGRAPFRGETFAELIANILTEPAPPLATLRPELPEELCAAVARCLEKDPDKRFQSVGELCAAIAGFGSRRSRVTADRVLRVVGMTDSVESSAQPLPLVRRSEPVESAPPSAAATNAGWARTGAATNKRSLVLMVGFAALAPIVVFAVVKLTQRPSEPVKAPSVSAPAVGALVPPNASAPAASAAEPSVQPVIAAPEPSVAPGAFPPASAPPASSSGPRAVQRVAPSAPSKPAQAPPEPAAPKKSLKIELK